jgi:hypothetical protein
LIQALLGLRAIAMTLSRDNLNITAAYYRRQYGASAYRKVGDDISIALAKRDWDRAYILQRVQGLIRNVQHTGEAGQEPKRQDL